MALKNRSLVLAERLEGEIIPDQTFRNEYTDIPLFENLKDGEIIVENLYLSIDPAMCAWLNDRRSYTPPVQIGAVMRGPTLARVMSSKSAKIKKGDHVATMSGWTTFTVVKDSQVEKVSHLPLTDNLSILGPTGITAYFGMLEIGRPNPGETVVVSGAAGATGSIAGQLAKLQGARVIGIAGSDDKCRWLVEELGFDVALNYKDSDFEARFVEAVPDHIDVYYDNVGGKILDLCMVHAKEHARFVMCGGASQYNVPDEAGLKNYSYIVRMGIRMQGFIVFDYADRWPEARAALVDLLKGGKILTKETILVGGLDVAQQALRDLYKGVNTGKLLVHMKTDGARHVGQW
ncbi:zinc-binding dehydrogenase [Cadophora sp. DSE1049]|nr:zinc-binding dehydrogenase [Cadophora sp. DSE1049]